MNNSIPFHMIKNVKIDQIQCEPIKIQIDVSVPKLQEEVANLLKDHPLDTYTNQLCLTHKKSSEDIWHEGSGSLAYIGRIQNNEKLGHKSEVGFFNSENEYTEFNEALIGTEIEKVYNALRNKYTIGRFRVMGLKPNTCLAWHRDTGPRIHVAVNTLEGCKFALQDRLFHIPADGQAYYIDTTKDHSVFNGSNIMRLHLVATIG